MDAENRKKEINAAIRTKQFELEMKLSLKRLGAESEKQETRILMRQIDEQLAGLDEKKKEEKKRINALTRDHKALQDRLDRADALMAEIGGQLSPQQAKELILKKLYDAMQAQMLRYLNGEKRGVLLNAEALYSKYSTSLNELKDRESQSTDALNDIWRNFGYAAWRDTKRRRYHRIWQIAKPSPS